MGRLTLTLAEPILRPEDHALWATWMQTARAHAQTRAYLRRVDIAREVASDALAQHPNACAMWSGGKDSTVMVHLLASLGAKIPVASEKDDLDFDGEEDYVRRLADAWGLGLRILRPEVSLQAVVADLALTQLADADVHGRGAALSKEHFYRVVEAFAAPYDMVFLGLRAEESRGRKMNRACHGLIYQVGNRWRCQPIADWRGLDVFAYAEVNGIDLLPVYRCIALNSADEPWMVRKSWWLPGAQASRGQGAWLRHYYPSLWRRLIAIWPDAQRLA